MPEPAGVRQQTPVELRYEDLTHGIDLSASIEAAFGADALGIMTVSGVPGVAERRRALLPLARRFAALPEAVKRKYEHAASFYSFGWSHGKEKLQGRPDTHKGSWYANPLHDRPTEDASLIERFPAFYHPNIWPREDLPELQPAFIDMGRLIVEVCLGSQMCIATKLACRSGTHSLCPLHVCMCSQFQVGALVARQCDAYVRSRSATYSPRRLETIVRESTVAKGRLLHYFSMDAQGGGGTEQQDKQGKKEEDDVSTWCGWHNDHGSLTGLTPAMYLDEAGHEVDPGQLQQAAVGSGLFVLSRSGELVQVVGVPADRLIFQIGETAEIHSGGVLQATPHAVKGGWVAVSGVGGSTSMDPGDWLAACMHGVHADSDRMD